MVSLEWQNHLSQSGFRVNVLLSLLMDAQSISIDKSHHERWGVRTQYANVHRERTVFLSETVYGTERKGKVWKGIEDNVFLDNPLNGNSKVLYTFHIRRKKTKVIMTVTETSPKKSVWQKGQRDTSVERGPEREDGEEGEEEETRQNNRRGREKGETRREAGDVVGAGEANNSKKVAAFSVFFFKYFLFYKGGLGNWNKQISHRQTFLYALVPLVDPAAPHLG